MIVVRESGAQGLQAEIGHLLDLETSILVGTQQHQEGSNRFPGNKLRESASRDCT